MKKAVNNPYIKFKKALEATETIDGRRWSGLSFRGTEGVWELWKSMSSISRGKVVSDSRWNHYPLCSFTKTSKRKHGAIIGSIVNRSLESGNQDLIRPLVNKSTGVFAVYMLDGTTSSDRIKMSKRLKRCPDQRVRSRCAKILPVRHIRDMIEDKSYSVRSAVISRIGIDNCYEAFIPTSISNSEDSSGWWWRNWYGRQALKLADKEQIEGLSEEVKNINTEEVDLRRLELTISTLISRMSPEEALYFIGLGERSAYIKRALESKFNSHI